MHPELIYICCLCWNINLPGDHGYFSHAGLLLFMSIHSGSSALDRVYWGRDLLGFPRCWLLHGGSAGCWCTCGSKCKGTIEPERKMPLFSLCFCSTLALADDSFQSMFLSAAVPAVSAFLLRCPPPKAPRISSLGKMSSLLRHPFSHHRARRVAGNGLGQGGLAWPVVALVQYNYRGDHLGISPATSAV